MNLLSSQLKALLDQGQSAILVRLEAADGSTPRDTDAAMVVTAAQSLGTIGGGELEWRCINEARLLLKSEEFELRLTVALGPSTGQCCGGRAKVHLEAVDSSILQALEIEELEAKRNQPNVLIFGAGHVGTALSSALEPLPFNVRTFDTRADTQLSWSSAVPLIIRALPETAIQEAARGSAFVILTHNHGLDFMLAEVALRRGDAAYVGMIGSRTKRKQFESYLRRSGADESLINGLTSPIGNSKLSDKRPPVIAALVAAELLSLFDQRNVEAGNRLSTQLTGQKTTRLGGLHDNK